jgi:hypothetical protein
LFDLPNWKDANAYPQCGKASNKQFAWEFLRRNSKYHETWADYIRRLREGIGQDLELSRLVDYFEAPPERRREIYEATFQTAPEWNRVVGRLHDLPVFNVTRDTDDGGRRCSPLDRWLALPWGLDTLASPLQDYDFLRVRFRAKGSVSMPSAYHLAELEKEGELGRVPDKWLILKIDLEWPVEVIEQQVSQQIKWNRDHLVNAGLIQPMEGRARPDKWCEYLRLLDAQAQGVTFAEIGEALYPGEPDAYPEYSRTKRLKSAFNAACKLRDGGYMALPMMRSRITKAKRKHSQSRA